MSSRISRAGVEMQQVQTPISAVKYPDGMGDQKLKKLLNAEELMQVLNSGQPVDAQFLGEVDWTVKTERKGGEGDSSILLLLLLLERDLNVNWTDQLRQTAFEELIQDAAWSSGRAAQPDRRAKRDMPRYRNAAQALREAQQRQSALTSQPEALCANVDGSWVPIITAEGERFQAVNSAPAVQACGTDLGRLSEYLGWEDLHQKRLPFQGTQRWYITMHGSALFEAGIWLVFKRVLAVLQQCLTLGSDPILLGVPFQYLLHLAWHVGSQRPGQGTPYGLQKALLCALHDALTALFLPPDIHAEIKSQHQKVVRGDLDAFFYASSPQGSGDLPGNLTSQERLAAFHEAVAAFVRPSEFSVRRPRTAANRAEDWTDIQECLLFEVSAEYHLTQDQQRQFSCMRTSRVTRLYRVYPGQEVATFSRVWHPEGRVHTSFAPPKYTVQDQDGTWIEPEIVYDERGTALESVNITLKFPRPFQGGEQYAIVATASSNIGAHTYEFELSLNPELDGLVTSSYSVLRHRMQRYTSRLVYPSWFPYKPVRSAPNGMVPGLGAYCTTPLADRDDKTLRYLASAELIDHVHRYSTVHQFQTKGKLVTELTVWADPERRHIPRGAYGLARMAPTYAEMEAAFREQLHGSF